MAAPWRWCISPTFVRSARPLPTSTGAPHQTKPVPSLRQRLRLGPHRRGPAARDAARPEGCGRAPGERFSPTAPIPSRLATTTAAIRTQQGRPASPAAPRSPRPALTRTPGPGSGAVRSSPGRERSRSGAGAGLGRAPRRGESCGLRAAGGGLRPLPALPQAGGEVAGCVWGPLVAVVPCSLAAGRGGEGSPSLLCVFV